VRVPHCGANETFDRHPSVGCPVEVVASSSGQEELPVNALLVSFAVIFVAEMGDKSQLMALTFATRYRALPILVGIAIATAAVHAVSVVVGAVLAVSLPTDVINVVAGLAFLGFAAWTIRGDRLSEDEAAKVERQSNRSAIAAASGAFFLAELGDKTMLATITLASTDNPWWVWLGSTVGMVAADALAIVVGRLLGRRLPERAITIFASVMFVLFGVALLLEGFGVL
jgi:putative Ca2+/H+ antiporter (TMEM165/GDT1 family)